MIPTSAGQFEATKRRSLPPPEWVRGRLLSLAQPMPKGYIPYSVCYLLVDSTGGVHIIDPGWDSDDNWAHLISALEIAGRGIDDVVSIIATHLHPDHLGMAARLRTRTGAPLTLSAPESSAVRHHDWMTTSRTPEKQWAEWGVPVQRRAELTVRQRATGADPIPEADFVVNDGDYLRIPGQEMRVILTPGHTSGSICITDVEHNLLITGDHLLPHMFAGLGLGAPTANNPIADYLHSLDLVVDIGDHTEVLPGHGYRFTGLAERCAASRAHHINRNREVTEILLCDPQATIWNIAAQLSWTAGWSRLAGFFLYSALRQTAMHRAYAMARDGDARTQRSPISKALGPGSH